MSEILSREEFDKAVEPKQGGDPVLLFLEDVNRVVATIEAMAEALAIVDEDDGFQLAKTSIEAMDPLRKKGWLS